MVSRSTHPWQRLLTGGALLWSAGIAVFAANWPSWRGPDHTGIATETNAPVKWSRTENVRWRTALQAQGNSSPIVWGETVYLTESVQHRRRLVAYDRRNGRARWNTAVEASIVSPTARQNPPCSPSPVTDGTRVIAWFGSEGLHAWDMDGTRQWSLDLGPQRHQWGYGSSPVLSGGRVFLNFGPGAEEFIIAVDAGTGRELWRTRGPAPPAEDTYGTWSTPLPIQVGGRTQLLVALRDYFAGLDPGSGEELWRCDGMGLQAKASPVYGDGIATISGDLRGAEIGVRLEPGLKGNITDTHRLWRESPPRPRISTGIVREGRVYGARINGIVDCVSLESGEVVWEERHRGAGGNSPVWASPILIGNLLYVVNQAGDTMILQAGPEYRLVEVNRIGETCNATPAVAYGDLFLRTHTTLWCIRQPVAPLPVPPQSVSQPPPAPRSPAPKP
jgi:outer membrane protein assembly factor BamB